MTASFLQINYQSQILNYADEVTPLKFTNQKMLPIIKKLDGSYMNESLEIMSYLDSTGTFNMSNLKQKESFQWVTTWIDTISKPLFNLLMPYYINSLEFNDQDKNYFQKKKEIKRGPFSELVKKREQYIKEINLQLNALLPKINPFFGESKELSALDIMITSHLWGLYLAYDYRVDDRLHDYLQLVTKTCHFNYDHDWWFKKSS